MLTLILDILPFILFAVLQKRYGLKVALGAAVASGLVAITYEWSRLQSVEPFFAVSFGLLLLCGGLAYFNDNELFFKLQPSIMAFVLGNALLIAFYGFEYSVMNDMFQKMETLLEQNQQLHVPPELLFYFSRNLGFGLLALSALFAVTSLKLGTGAWLALRIVGLPVVSFICFFFAAQSMATA